MLNCCQYFPLSGSADIGIFCGPNQSQPRAKRATARFPLPLREVRRGSRKCPVDICAVEWVHAILMHPGGN